MYQFTKVAAPCLFHGGGAEAGKHCLRALFKCTTKNGLDRTFVVFTRSIQTGTLHCANPIVSMEGFTPG